MDFNDMLNAEAGQDPDAHRPTARRFLPLPTFVPLDYVSIEDALGMVGRSIFHSQWTDSDVFLGRWSSEDWLRRSFAETLYADNEVIYAWAEAAQLKAPGIRDRLRKTINHLLALLHAKKAHAVWFGPDGDRQVPMSDMWAGRTGRRAIEEGQFRDHLPNGSSPVTVYPVIHEPSLRAALEGKDVGSKKAPKTDPSPKAQRAFWAFYIQFCEAKGARPGRDDHIVHAELCGVSFTVRDIRALIKKLPPKWRSTSQDGEDYDREEFRAELLKAWEARPTSNKPT
jgi:hypothetical protein